MKFRDNFNLITSEPDSKLEENSLLFTVEHFFLLREFIDSKNEEEDILVNCINTCRIKKGIFMQHPSGLSGDDRYMSHDQLTAIFAFSYYLGLEYHKEIWQEIKRQWLRYDNVNPPTKLRKKLFNERLLHPRDIIFYGYCDGGFIFKLLLPVLIIIMFVSCWSKRTVLAYGAPAIKTDGKLLTYIRIRSLRINWLNKFFDWIIKIRFGCWGNVFKIYFRYSHHPNVINSILI